jgi:hypothetical protein
MKKLIFANNEEKKIIRHLHESAKKGIVIKEQISASIYTKDNSGTIGTDALGNQLFYQGFPGWNRDNDGPLGYWKMLFNVLTTHGIQVKWEKAGGDDSTYMYWGGWVIFKDLTKNGGYPVSFTDLATNVSTTFKFNGGRYTGQPADKIILEAKSINLTFNLGIFGRYDKKTMSELITKYLKEYPKGNGLIPQLNGVTDSPLDTDKPKKVGRPPNPSVTELQRNLNAKFSSGLKEDGYLGQKTRKAIYDALTKGTQQTTQQTTTALEPVKDETGTSTPGEDATKL